MNLEPWSEPTHSSTILYATSDLSAISPSGSRLSLVKYNPIF